MPEAEAIRLDHLEVQFQSMAQQKLASSQAMWVFLATEALFFGNLFVGYTILRFTYPNDFKIASHEMSLAFGTVNTVILMTSSLFMAMAVRAARSGKRARLSCMLLITALLGAGFLAVKGFEYAFDLRHHSVPGATMQIEGQVSTPPMHLFMFYYWVMTGFHGLHLIVGISLIVYVAVKALLGTYSKEYYNPVEVLGLYWHFVDVVWLFLYPALYLAGVGIK